jgi:hypothetical protein
MCNLRDLDTVLWFVLTDAKHDTASDGCVSNKAARGCTQNSAYTCECTIPRAAPFVRQLKQKQCVSKMKHCFLIL